MVSREDIDRLLWCQNLYIAYFILNVTNSNTAVFSHIFRSAMVRFADRGLVLQGRPNLKLFNQLFWLILVPYCCIGLMMAPFNSIIRGSFPQTYVAKHCIRPGVLYFWKGGDTRISCLSVRTRSSEMEVAPLSIDLFSRFNNKLLKCF